MYTQVLLKEGNTKWCLHVGAHTTSCKQGHTSWVVTMAASVLILSRNPTLCLSSHSSHMSYLDRSPDCSEEHILFPWYPIAQVRTYIYLKSGMGTVVLSQFMPPMLPPKKVQWKQHVTEVVETSLPCLLARHVCHHISPKWQCTLHVPPRSECLWIADPRE